MSIKNFSELETFHRVHALLSKIHISIGFSHVLSREETPLRQGEQTEIRIVKLPSLVISLRLDQVQKDLHDLGRVTVGVIRVLEHFVGEPLEHEVIIVGFPKDTGGFPCRVAEGLPGPDPRQGNSRLR